MWTAGSCTSVSWSSTRSATRPRPLPARLAACPSLHAALTMRCLVAQSQARRATRRRRLSLPRRGQPPPGLQLGQLTSGARQAAVSSMRKASWVAGSTSSQAGNGALCLHRVCPASALPGWLALTLLRLLSAAGLRCTPAWTLCQRPPRSARRRPAVSSCDLAQIAVSWISFGVCLSDGTLSGPRLGSLHCRQTCVHSLHCQATGAVLAAGMRSHLLVTFQAIGCHAQDGLMAPPQSRLASQRGIHRLQLTLCCIPRQQHLLHRFTLRHL
mmetsp:Transcript_3526/g.9819  ORF Transcript_3526/g.9819 Transcript_3526/m.9819 type:complete len:270 (+) Transcript_3526:1410-2219(+)